MEYLAIAYALIAIVLIAYSISVWQRTQKIERERVRLESKED